MKKLLVFFGGNKMKLISIHALYDVKSGKYVDVEVNCIDDICARLRGGSFYEKIYD